MAKVKLSKRDAERAQADLCGDLSEAKCNGWLGKAAVNWEGLDADALVRRAENSGLSRTRIDNAMSDAINGAAKLLEDYNEYELSMQ